MSATSDPTYLRLYQEFAAAIRAYERAVAERRKTRDMLAVRRSPVLLALQVLERRPVGMAVDAALRAHAAAHRAAPAQTNAVPGQAVHSVYLGPLLGWYRLRGASLPGEPALPESPERSRLYDQLSLELYWSAKRRYEEARAAFFAHVGRTNIATFRERAIGALGNAAHAQLLGADEFSEGVLEEARRHIEMACQSAWRIYEQAPRPKSAAVKILLLENVADSQFVGLDSATTQTMTAEVNRLLNAGELTRGGR